MHKFFHKCAQARCSYPAFRTAYSVVFLGVSHILIHNLELSKVIRSYSPGFSTIAAPMLAV